MNSYGPQVELLYMTVGECHFTQLREESPVGRAEVISFDEVRARKHWTTLRQRLHERFDQWLDRLESALPCGRADFRAGECHHLGLTAAANRWRCRDNRAPHASRGTASTADALSHLCAPVARPRPGAALRRDHGGACRCVVCDGAEWIWKHVQALFLQACQVLDYYHCAEYLHKVAKAQYADPNARRNGPRRPSPDVSGQSGASARRSEADAAHADEALKAIDNCWVYLNDHRGRTHYRTLRRGGYPLGSGGMESANKFICHVRLKRSEAWWYEESSNQMLALRCAKYNGTFDLVFARRRDQKIEG